MIKYPISYHNYEDEPITKEFYFHLNKFEWLELEAYTKGGLVENLRSALDVGNAKKTIDILKKIILRAYGEKDHETGEFKKSEEISIAFSRTEAFSELFYELAYDENKSKEFFTGLIPREMRADVPQKAQIIPKIPNPNP